MEFPAVLGVFLKFALKLMKGVWVVREVSRFRALSSQAYHFPLTLHDSKEQQAAPDDDATDPQQHASTLSRRGGTNGAIRYVLGVHKPGCFKPGCLQFCRGSALLRPFALFCGFVADLRNSALFCGFAFALFWGSYAIFCASFLRGAAPDRV